MDGAVEYTMDEEDEEWLLGFNREVEKGEAERPGNGAGAATARQSRSTIGEDEFELVMEAFEKALDEQREQAMRAVSAHSMNGDEMKLNQRPFLAGTEPVPHPFVQHAETNPTA